ncbi:MAG: sulfite exporter TauE/SafE family protein [Azospirillum sp.]|nr:sulfite exporter TauE/SafE family protein [Azospirillum sp.]
MGADIPGEIWLALGLFLASVASGLAGFAFALIASATALHFRDPVDATPLILAGSLLAQCLTILAFRGHVRWDRLLPFVACGLAGIPIGAWLLSSIPADPLRKAIGAFLVGYALYMLTRSRSAPVAWGGKAADGAVGFLGGVLGGLAGLSGALPTLWAGLRGWPRDEQRAVYQPYIFAMQTAALAALWTQGAIGPRAVADFAWCLPPVVLGAWLGLKLYGRVDDAQFRRIVLGLLLASGVVLLV